MTRAPNPYVVGQWVRGDRFYGRRREVAEILEGGAERLWFVGLRRVGKTSLLKQAEHMAGGDPLVPLFWDLQGAVDETELGLTFRDTLHDAVELLAARGIAVDALPTDAAAAIAELAEGLRARAAKLLLLCDEVEELLELARRAPPAFQRLWRVLTESPCLRVVLSSSPRFAALGPADLAQLSPPRYLGRLDAADAFDLVVQGQLPAAARPAITSATATAVVERCGGHPFLVQLLGRRLVECGDLETACEQLAHDRMVAHLVAADLALLTPAERRLVHTVASEPDLDGPALVARTGLPTEDLEPLLDRLEALGAIARDGGAARPGSELLRRHLLAC